jgi:hypothetical protein
MAEKSYFWTTGGAGDGSSTYSTADWSAALAVVAACSGLEGVAPSFLNELAGTVTGANTVAINTGGGMVDGKPYRSTASENVTIPSAVGGGNTRIDRIVLRASWAAQTVRITRIAGTNAASPTAPAITQTSGTTYDIPLYRALVNTSGTVTLTDERTWAIVATDDSTLENNAGTLRIKDAGVTTAKILDANVTLAKLAANSVDDTKVGDRVPQFYRRQGGSASSWASAGTTTYTPGAVRMQAGIVTITGTGTITYPVAFSQPPIVILSSSQAFILGNSIPGATNVQAFVWEADGTTPATAPTTIAWLAIGPE